MNPEKIRYYKGLIEDGKLNRCIAELLNENLSNSEKDDLIKLRAQLGQADKEFNNSMIKQEDKIIIINLRTW